LSLAEVARLVREGEDFLVVPHRRPDADALGSSLGLASILRALGKRATLFVPSGPPRSLTFLVQAGQLAHELAPDARFDATFVLDAASPELLPDGMPGADRRGALVVLDHHATHTDFGDLALRDPAASATAVLVVRLARELDVHPLPRDAATPLYAALAADTGGFRYLGTTAATMRLGAELLDAGADAWTVSRHLFEDWPLGRLRLLGALVQGLSLEFDGRLAILRVSRALMRATGADDDMVDGLVNYGRMLQGVEVSALFWEWPAQEGRAATKLSLRSNGHLDVSQVALAFGGGGHPAAAGALSTLSLEATVERLRAEVLPLLSR